MSENFCASGSEAFRGAVYAVAAWSVHIALALGVEKLKDTGYGGLPAREQGTLNYRLWETRTAPRPAILPQLASAYRAKHKVSRDDLKRAIAHVSVKSHANGAKNPKAHLQKPITEEMCLKAPMIAEPLDGSSIAAGVSDGAACAIVTTPEIAKNLGKTDLITVKALQLALSNGLESQHNSWDGSYFHTARIAARRAYEEACIRNRVPRYSMMEVHDCFSITELVTMEDLHISREARDGKTCSTDSTMPGAGCPAKSMVGSNASDTRSAPAPGISTEMYLQLLGRAGPRQLASPGSASRTISVARLR